MALQLQYVFSGERSRRGEVQSQAEVDGSAVGVEKIREVGCTRSGQSAEKRFRDLRRCRTGNADHRHRASPGCAGDGGDGVERAHKLKIEAWRPRLRKLYSPAIAAPSRAPCSSTNTTSIPKGRTPSCPSSREA